MDTFAAMRTAIIFNLFLLFCMPLTGKAAAYWMDVKGSGKLNHTVKVEVCYGNIDEYSIRHRDTGKELKLTGDFKFMLISPGGQKVPLAITQQADCWAGEFTPTEKGTYRILGINDSHPVVDRSKTGGINVRPIDYLAATYDVETITPLTIPIQFLDIVTSREGKTIHIKAFNNGKPAAKGTKLRVFNPENWEKELTVDEKGEAFFNITMPGPYIIREDWDDAVTGTYKALSYTSVRHRCNYCLPITQ
ncbi:hypothetical protein [Mucilaginibacter polytrichastri]|uniref:DUF4198 domain-containing protein n=1 Tax=Mucilaginibacter polytrichastri TaxID=1302689 RepID=A0A1Q6A3C1_9SPHI|nr:hypothetical protein [Mucilaginibacter polytrichastri]OKS88491.1 hypothetical protein RG47T_3959 [Mucilaginibacter polytrichastri]SFT12089.1 hypothetical protein SAMN04487890_111131 [Mucilaginibacter polytrichastri]